MKKIDLGQTITVLANLAVLFGILLLAYELTQNREMTRAQTRQSIAELLVNLIKTDATDPLLPEIHIKRISGQTLTAVEEYRLESYHEAFWRYRESVHFQYRNGLYDEDEYLALRAVWIRNIEADDWYRGIYCERRNRQTPELTAEIDSLMTIPCE